MTEMATARAHQAADRAKVRRWRRKHNLKVVPVEVPVDLPVRAPETEEEMRRSYRAVSLEEKMGLGDLLAAKIRSAEHQIDRWKILDERLSAFPNELQWCGVRISGQALAKAKEIAASRQVVFVSDWGDLDWGATITDASCIHAEPDYLKPLLTLLGTEIPPSIQAKLKL